MSGYALRLLGPPELDLEGVRLSLPSRKLWAVVAYLASQNGPVSREKLAGLLWEEGDEERARANLRQELYRLRGTPAETLLIVRSDSLALAEHDSDLQKAEQCLENRDWKGALRVSRGEFAAGLSVRGAPAFEDWLLLEREYWQGKWAEAACGRAGELETAHPSEAKALYERILEADPFQEDVQRRFIRVVAGLEGAAAALKLYERYKTLLHKEFSLEPLSETVVLVENIRKGRHLPAPPSASLPQPISLENPPLVGREREWALMETAWNKGQAIYLSGPPGVGKTRLMLEFAAQKGPYSHFEGRQSDTGVPYGYVVRTLRQALEQTAGLELPGWARRELSRFYPELGEEPPPIASETDKLRLFEALTELIRRLGEVGIRTITADDIQFVTDTASMEFVAYSMERLLPQGKLHSITTFRPDEMHPAVLAGIEAQVRQGIAVRLELEPLDSAATEQFVQTLSGQAAPVFARRLHQDTGGNPLFMLETVRSLLSAGEILVEDGHWSTRYDQQTEDYRELPLPNSVREAVLGRVGRLGGAVRRLLEAASLAGEGFSLGEISGATALSEWEELEAAETAQKAGLLRQGPDGLNFAHDLLRRALSTGLSEERRKVLHRKLAEGLARLEGPPARVAEHLERAGQPKDAVVWRVKAAEAAERVYANAEAIQQYQKALEDGPTASEAFAIREARANLFSLLNDREAWATELEGLGRLLSDLPDPSYKARTGLLRIGLHNRSGRFGEALTEIELLSKMLRVSPEQRLQLLLERGRALSCLGRFAEAERYLSEALELTSEAASERIGEINLLLFDCARSQGNIPLAHRRNEAARTAFHFLGDRKKLVSVLRNTGILAHASGDLTAAIAALEQAVAEARASGNVSLRLFCLADLFGSYNSAGEFAKAIPVLEEGLALAKSNADPINEGTFLSNLGHAQTQYGEFGAAIGSLQSAIRLADRLSYARQRVWRRLSLVELYLDLGCPDPASTLLEDSRTLIGAANLGQVSPWLETLLAHQSILKDDFSGALHRLQGILAEPTAIDTDDQMRTLWLMGLACVLGGSPEQALEAVSEATASVLFSARVLAVKLRARALLGQSAEAEVAQAEGLLQKSKVAPVERLELYEAMISVAQPTKARKYRQAATELVLKIAASLEAFPEFRAGFLGKHGHSK